jgi:hypothetical protein
VIRVLCLEKETFSVIRDAEALQLGSGETVNIPGFDHVRFSYQEVKVKTVYGSATRHGMSRRINVCAGV